MHLWVHARLSAASARNGLVGRADVFGTAFCFWAALDPDEWIVSMKEGDPLRHLDHAVADFDRAMHKTMLI